MSVIPNINFNDEEHKYEVSLPLKENSADNLPTDYDLCRNSLNSLFNRLKGRPGLLHEYDSTFKEQLNSGIIERVPMDEEDKAGAHFICHHGVGKLDRETYHSTKKRQHNFDILTVFFSFSSDTHQSMKTSDNDLKVNLNIYPDAS